MARAHSHRSIRTDHISRSRGTPNASFAKRNAKFVAGERGMGGGRGWQIRRARPTFGAGTGSVPFQRWNVAASRCRTLS
jgi:hypothetical protein